MSFDLKKTKNHNQSKTVSANKDFFSDKTNDQEVVKKEVVDSVSWRAPEYEVYEKSATWYLVAIVLLGIIIAYALWKDSPIMAITFILIGVVGYLQLQKEPRILDFSINHNGIRAGNEIYEFDNIESFWIFYDPPHTKTLSLHTNASFIPFVHIPLADEDPVVVREVLMKFVPEEKQEAGFVDALERFLHI